ncbi:cyclic nucleotide-binding protein [Croceivirga lutea]|uniref:Crp/Fnr family transcriptional regulator n=1 Tax=Croceivirga lutea TaxID=1775167 RepID=UPI001639639F|nr:Crp/Fnr family transcriptional regulator [Croceivirga lutea]GGG35172.1 cyclic nucleotide-binding protein [Croceivirga lutea]
MKNLLIEYISEHIELNEDEKNAIESLNIFHSIKKGEVLLKQGEISHKGYFVIKGCIRSYYIINGEEKSTAFYTELEGVTPHCVLNNKPSEYYLNCIEDSIILISNPEMEAEIFQKFPKFESLCRILSEKLLTKNQIDLDKFKISSPEQRYKNLLENRPDLVQRIPQHQLASFLGIKPQSLSRIKARMLVKKIK